MLVCLLVLSAGCGRGSKEPPPPTGPSTAPASPRNPGRIAEAPPPATIIPNSGDANATLQQLTQTLRDYVVRTRSVPKNFEEFAAKSQVQFPPAPAGKKYAIQGQQIVLLDR